MKLFDDFSPLCTDISVLAQGGQKFVYSAVHRDYGAVVIKVGEYRHATTLERLTREVQLLREISSKYYPKNFEFLIDPLRREFLIVEERLDAVELTHVKSLFRDSNSTLQFVRQLVQGLDLIWQRNVVHRDIKPANILVTSANEPRIIDLGIARFLDEASLTASVGGGPRTPIYAAPEQLLNRKPMIGVRTDFFLLGLLALELLLQAHPFDPIHVGNQRSLIENILAGEHVPVPDDCDDILKDFIRLSLATQPYDRFRTSDSLLAFLKVERLTC